MNIFIPFFFIVFFLIFPFNIVNSQDTSSTYKDREKVENNTDRFDPSVLYSGKNKHIAIKFNVVEGNLVLSDSVAEVMHGKMPYKSKTGGHFIVIGKNRKGVEILRYYTPDIRIIRAFDGENKESSYIKNAKDLFILM